VKYLYQFGQSNKIFDLDPYYYLDLILLTCDHDTIQPLHETDSDYRNPHGQILDIASSKKIEDLLMKISERATGQIKNVFNLFLGLLYVAGKPKIKLSLGKIKEVLGEMILNYK
jgi:hypothetical protein